MDHSNLSAIADATRCRERHSPSLASWLDFLTSDETSRVLNRYLGRDHKVIADYGCGEDARLGVLLMNRLRLTDSSLLGIDSDARRLDLLGRSYPSVSHQSNLCHRLEGDYFQSVVSGVDISVVNL